MEVDLGSLMSRSSTLQNGAGVRQQTDVGTMKRSEKAGPWEGQRDLLGACVLMIRDSCK